MAYEIINHAQVTPHRLHALVRLVSELDSPAREEVINLLQPPQLVENQDSAVNVLTAAVNCKLVRVDTSGTKGVHLLASREDVETTSAFRKYMQQELLGATDVTQPNYLLNLFAAWYAVQNESVLTSEPGTYHVRFNNELFPDAQDREFNPTKLHAWNNWATFLGLGWPMKLGGRREVVVPNARGRVADLIAEYLPADGSHIEFGPFLDRLASACPELDRGALFERCRQASRGHEASSTRLSLMLSTALRQLHDERKIELIRLSDATTVWTLHPAEGHPLREITHVKSGVS